MVRCIESKLHPFEHNILYKGEPIISFFVLNSILKTIIERDISKVRLIKTDDNQKYVKQK